MKRLLVVALAGVLLLLEAGTGEAAWYASCPACARHLGGSGIAGPYPDKATCELYRGKMVAQNFPFGPCYSDGASAPAPTAPSTPGSGQPVYTPPPPAPSRPPVASTPGNTTGGDCQDACLAACPKRSGAFGSPEVDRACAQRCLSLECPVPTQRPASTAPDAPVELSLAGVTPRRAMSRGPLVVTAAALPVGGSFSWRLSDPQIAALENPRSSQGVFSMPGRGPANVQGSSHTLIPLRPGRVEITVQYSLNGRSASKSATVDFFPPLLFLHGIASNADTWSAMKAELEATGLIFGGRLCATCGPARQGDFYTSDFPRPQDSYIRQGSHVADWISQVAAQVPREASGAGRRVALVAHSMGGLAARAYMQGPSYRGDVAALVTVGTPHAGSIAAQFAASDRVPTSFSEVCKSVIKYGAQLFVRRVVPLDFNSEGVRELALVSEDMKKLRNTVGNLPRDVQYAFVVGVLPHDIARELLDSYRAQIGLKLGKPVVDRCFSENAVWQTFSNLLSSTDGLVDKGSQDLSSIAPHLKGRPVIRTEAIHCCNAPPLQAQNETDQTAVILSALRKTGLFEALFR